MERACPRTKLMFWSRLGKAKAYSALAHKLGRAFYHLLHTKEVFDVNRFVRH